MFVYLKYPSSHSIEIKEIYLIIMSPVFLSGKNYKIVNKRIKLT